MTTEEIIDDCAGSILEHLANIIPDWIEDNGELGELVLEKALETYREVNLIELSQQDKGEDDDKI